MISDERESEAGLYNGLPVIRGDNYESNSASGRERASYAMIFRTFRRVIRFGFTFESRKATRNAFRHLRALLSRASIRACAKPSRCARPASESASSESFRFTRALSIESSWCVQGRVRRAKLYYLRKLRGKAARIRERDTRGERAMAAAAAAASRGAAESVETVATPSEETPETSSAE